MEYLQRKREQLWLLSGIPVICKCLQQSSQNTVQVCEGLASLE